MTIIISFNVSKIGTPAINTVLCLGQITAAAYLGAVVQPLKNGTDRIIRFLRGFNQPDCIEENKRNAKES